MKVLITGGAGFIGSNYVYTHLEARPQDELFVLDALIYGSNRDALNEAIGRGVTLVHGKVQDKRLVDQLFEQEAFDAVVHFAAETHVDHSIADPAKFVVSNVQGTQVLLDAARKFGVKRFHHISTDEVYGDLPLDSPDMFTEESLLKPSNPYSATKAASDMLCLAYHRTYDLSITISRCTNNFGPWQTADKLIPMFMMRAMNDELLTVHGNGKNIRDWLYVTDHCEAVLHILEGGRSGEIYNISANNPRSNLEITKKIIELTGKTKDLITFVEDRKGNDLKYAVDSSKLKDELGWEPRVDFEAGMFKTYNWYKLQYLKQGDRSKTGLGSRVRQAIQAPFKKA